MSKPDNGIIHLLVVVSARQGKEFMQQSVRDFKRKASNKGYQSTDFLFLYDLEEYLESRGTLNTQVVLYCPRRQFDGNPLPK